MCPGGLYFESDESTPTVSVTLSGCGPPSSGDWEINDDCTLEESYTAPGDVIVEPGAVLTIAPGAALDIDFENHALIFPSHIPIEPLSTNTQSLINSHIGSFNLRSNSSVFKYDEMGNRLETKEIGLSTLISEVNDLNQ